MSVRNTLAGALLALAAAVTWYWSRPPATAPATRSAADRVALGYYLRGAEVIGTDDTGRITYIVAAERMEELPGEERFELADVTIEYRPESDVAWRMSAERGTVPRSRAHYELSGGVTLSNAPGHSGVATVATAPTMTFAPDELTVDTAAPVELNVGGDVLRAIGLKAHLKDDTLRLESAVHGRFVP